MRTFYAVLVNTAVANVTTSFLWFALTFWVYLETRSVLATGLIGGAYMLLMALLSMVFGTIVDRHRKHEAMVVATATTLLAFLVAGGIYLLQPESALVDLGGPWFWVFSAIILFGGVIENMRSIALSTTVTLLVPVERHANANGLVGTVAGLVFAVTSVFSGLSIGLLGMGWTLLISIVAIAATLVHLLFIRIAEERPVREEHASSIDFRGAWRAVRLVPGLFALILFSCFNNLVGGAHLALLDAYGLQLFSVEWWGVVLAISSTGFIIGGLLVARFGLGRRPMRTLLLLVAFTGVLGAVLAIREWGWLLIVTMWCFMAVMPAVEAAEQTVIQKVVPFRTQGRVFGFAQAFEAAAAPVTAFVIAPLAQYAIIPYVDSASGRAAFEWLLGEGQARGIALVFLVAGIVIVAAALLAFLTKSYGRISQQYAAAPGEEPQAAASAV